MTTATLALYVRALAFAREAVNLSPFAQVLVDEAGQTRERYTASRTLTCVRRTSGRVPDRLVVIMNEGAAFEE